MNKLDPSRKLFLSLFVFFLCAFQTQAQSNKAIMDSLGLQPIQISGYAQARYNGLFETNPDLEVPQMDRNWGADKGISFRRVRLKVEGWVHPRVYYYFQADFAGTPTLRDAYMDVYLSDQRKWWLRIGQSKIPFGYENMQSSSRRLPLDRSDAINSALPNERDLGVLLYYTPVKTRKVYDYINDNNLKHSGNYGAFALGIYNGQGINVPDKNDNFHGVVRASNAWQFSNNQILEVSLHAYKGLYVLKDYDDDMQTIGSQGDLVSVANRNFLDDRVGTTIMWYPQPIGFQFEYNYGRGPEYDPSANLINDGETVQGFYAMLIGNIHYKKMQIFPFSRYIYYRGGKKFELDARKYEVNDLEIGIEWQFNKYFELVTMYTIADRVYEDHLKPVNHQAGNLLRLQAQVNF